MTMNAFRSFQNKCMDFNNKIVLVTGGSSGIGRQIAIEFVRHNAKVVIVGRNEEKLKITLEKCETVGERPLAIVADLTNDEDIKRIVETTINSHNKLDVLVNCAGVCNFNSIFEDNAITEFDRTMKINLRALVYLTHLTTSYLGQTKGSIINISSCASDKIIIDKTFAYVTSKAAIDHFTRSVALELASKCIRVNTVNPGPVKTDLVETLNVKEREQLWDQLEKATALGKVSTAVEIAEMVLFLASDKARSITGSSFVIDNGIKLKGLIRD